MNEVDKFVYRTVCDHFGIDIKNKTRRRNYVEARRIYFKVLKEIEPLRSLSSMGNSLKSVKFNHATVLHHIRQLDNFLTYDKELSTTYNNILEICLNFKKGCPDKINVDNIVYEYKSLRQIPQQRGQDAGISYEVYRFKTFKQFCSTHT